MENNKQGEVKLGIDFARFGYLTFPMLHVDVGSFRNS